MFTFLAVLLVFQEDVGHLDGRVHVAVGGPQDGEEVGVVAREEAEVGASEGISTIIDRYHMDLFIKLHNIS